MLMLIPPIIMTAQPKETVVPLLVLSLQHTTHEERVQWFKDNGQDYPVIIEVRGPNSDGLINFVGRELRGLQFTGLSGLVMVITNDVPYASQDYEAILLRKRGKLFNIFENPDMDYIDKRVLHQEVVALYNAVYDCDIFHELFPELYPKSK